MADEQWDMLSFEQGCLAVVSRRERLIRICFESSTETILSRVGRLYPEAKKNSDSLTEQALTQLREYLFGRRRIFDLSLECDLLTPFALRVHSALMTVAYGTTVSYDELATMAGFSRAARAVGGVMKANPFPLVVPCHRVVMADGRIGHYSAAGGCKTKSWLIEFEQRIAGGQLKHTKSELYIDTATSGTTQINR